jgi:hypothetical protein
MQQSVILKRSIKVSNCAAKTCMTAALVMVSVMLIWIFNDWLDSHVSTLLVRLSIIIYGVSAYFSFMVLMYNRDIINHHYSDNAKEMNEAIKNAADSWENQNRFTGFAAAFMMIAVLFEVFN